MTAIDYVKQHIQKPRALLLIKGDLRAQRVLSAWEYYDPAPILEMEKPPPAKMSPKQVLGVLWERCGDPDMRRLAKLSGIPESKVADIFWRLKEAALLWPDGTLSTVAEKVLTAESNAYIDDLNARQKRSR